MDYTFTGRLYIAGNYQAVSYFYRTQIAHIQFQRRCITFACIKPGTDSHRNIHRNIHSRTDGTTVHKAGPIGLPWLNGISHGHLPLCKRATNRLHFHHPVESCLLENIIFINRFFQIRFHLLLAFSQPIRRKVSLGSQTTASGGMYSKQRDRKSVV